MKICRPKFKAYAVVFLIGMPSSLREIYDTLNVNYFFLSMPSSLREIYDTLNVNYFFLSKVLRLGQKNRHMASTKLNQLSSRRYVIFW